MEQDQLLSMAEKKPVMGGVTWAAFVEERKKLSSMAVPMVVVSVAHYLLQVVSLMMAGHLGELSLSGVSIATSFTNVTGFSLLLGMSEALETLCGQAYGAGQYQKFGSYIYCAIITFMPVCLLVSILWSFMDRMLNLIGQDPQISMIAAKYAVWLMPGLFAFAILQCLMRYFLSQSMILPMLITSCASLCFHIPLCWALVYKCRLGVTGAAVSIGLSYWLNVVLAIFYISYSPSCVKTRLLCWKDVSSSIKEFLRFALPSASMVCLEWWTFELVILLSGILPDSELETSVLSICLTASSLHYNVVYGISGAASTRVSNELGAGNPQGARVAVIVSLIVSLAEAVIVSIILFACRYVLGYAFSRDKEVVDYVTKIAPLLSLAIIVDSLQAVLSAGIARGCGWQNMGAFINLGAYYAVGIPVAVVLCFILHLQGRGLWIGIVTGTTVQVILFSLITALTDWQKQATKVRRRIAEGTISDDNELPQSLKRIQGNGKSERTRLCETERETIPETIELLDLKQTKKDPRQYKSTREGHPSDQFEQESD
ncbi:hypothetical protein Tsubulata_008941 [Turnera subulata]|uniref:Protein DETOXIFICATION n=1 Tax=Turnera subulata TaxID=218843 RepID=A0A9Q0IYY6_9ROSI|nr:hypothetical protein Tsubulata_008941 [Turnera subulata]